MAVSATAPLGGCKQRRRIINAIARLPASATERMGVAINFAQVIPTTAAIKLPPMMDQGYAKGLAGTANNNTADAPMGAINQGLKSPRKK